MDLLTQSTLNEGSFSSTVDDKHDSISQKIQYYESERSALLTFNNQMAKVRKRPELLKLINGELKALLNFAQVEIQIVSPDHEHVIPFLKEEDHVISKVINTSHSFASIEQFNNGIYNVILESQLPVIFDLKQISGQDSVPDYIKKKYQSGFLESISATLFISHEQRGILTFDSANRGAFNPQTIKLIQVLASFFSAATAQILANEELHKREQEKSLLLMISNDITQIREKADLLNMINNRLGKFCYFTHSLIGTINDNGDAYCAYILDPNSKILNSPSHHYGLQEAPMTSRVMRSIRETEDAVIVNLKEAVRAPDCPIFLKANYELGIEEAIITPLKNENGHIGCLILFSDRIKTFTDNLCGILSGIGSQVAVAVSNILANERIQQQLIEISNYREQLEEENLYLKAPIDSPHDYKEIVGSGQAMHEVFRLISQVSASNSTVLILGETGTGKELIARAIHNGSPRKNKPMIKVNCAALPEHLIESELFGHERGSFTGATERRIGKFELAHNGTLFLDEIGEMPLNLQVKLLRALQEREIERVGGKETIKVNVRIIAATNRNLVQEVTDFKFRSDLYYRLNVFPIILPSLRERREDIPVLTAHFIAHYSKSLGKKITNISKRAQYELSNYDWPGNVRELEHLIERSLLLTSGTSLKEIYLPTSKIGNAVIPTSEGLTIKTLDDHERDYIIKVLQKCNGKISGYGGAASLLGVPSSTLSSKITKLKITKDQIMGKLN